MIGKIPASLPLAVAAMSLLICVPAFANGGDFFEELSATWQNNSDDGVPYFGFVRDARGKRIPMPP